MRKFIITGLILVIILCAPSKSLAEKGDFISSVNVMVSKGNKVELPKEVFYSAADNATYGQIEVFWDMISDDIFNQEGRHEITGKTKDNQKVTGFIHVFENEKEIHIASIGDSITASDWDGLVPYPTQLENRLEDNFKITNLGHSGATLSDYGHKPYRKIKQYDQSKTLLANAVVIQLGTNDSWATNWLDRKVNETFKEEYINFIKEYQEMNEDTIIYVCLPPETLLASYIMETRIEILKAVRELDGFVTVIDNYTPTKEEASQKGYYPDELHPNSKALATISNNIYDNLHGSSIIKKKKTISVRDFDKSSQVVLMKEAKTDDYYLDQISNGDWVSFRNVDFNDSYREMLLTTASLGAKNVNVEVHLDSLEGQVIGSGMLRKESTWENSAFNIEAVTGIHDIFLKFTHPNKDKFEPLIKLKEVDINYKNNKKELLKNGNFESEMNYWQVSGIGNSVVNNINAYQGNKFSMFGNSYINKKLEQTVTDLEDGVYTISAMVKRTGLLNDMAVMEIVTDNQKTTNHFIKATNKYEQIQETVEVADGELTVAFRYIGILGNLQVDSVNITRKP